MQTNLKPFFYIVIFLLFANYSFGQADNKRLYIINATTKAPIEDASVQTDDIFFNANADENGMIKLNLLTTTVTVVVISRIGFDKTSRSY